MEKNPAPAAINLLQILFFFYGMDFGVVFAALPQLLCLEHPLGFGIGVRVMLGMVCVPSVGTGDVQALGQWRVLPAGLE